MNPHKIYFGGSRSLACQGQNSILHQVVSAVIESGSVVHVGCQLGADKEVALSVLYRSFLSLVVFAVSPTIKQSPAHVQRCARGGAQIVLAAGGTSAPIPARYLLRSIAAFQGCSHAVFFEPGRGSLAVARECAKVNSLVSVVTAGIMPSFNFSASRYLSGVPAVKLQNGESSQ
jgi:hypothetical protein